MPSGTVESIDEVKGGQATEHIINGESAVVYATLSDVEGLDTGEQATNAKAILAASPYLRTLGSACPGIMEPNYLEEITPICVGPNTWRLALKYKGFPKLQIEIDTTLSCAQANIDKDGVPIVVEYQYPAEAIAKYPELAKNNPPGYVKQGGFIQRRVQQTALRLKYIVTASGSMTASDRVLHFAQAYVGTINQFVWASAPGPARCWLCESVKGISRDGGKTYEMNVEFAYRNGTPNIGESGSNSPSHTSGQSLLPGGWDFLVVFIDPYTGLPPADLKKGLGYKAVRGYTEVTLPQMPPPGVS